MRRQGLKDTAGLEGKVRSGRAAPRLPAVVAAAIPLALLASACGADAPPPPPAAESPTPATATTPVATDTPAAERPSPTDPSGPYFDLDRVLDISIEIAPEDWETLRHQTRTFEDLLAEIEEHQLSRPFADIYTWFPATVTVDGERHTEVGVRKKGFLGSQSDTKPSLKLRFDKYVDGQALGGVMERMTLNNSVQDASLVNTCLAHQVFARAGIPASRCSFATVSVNGKALGLYIHLEEIKKPFLARHFASAEGNLYEGTVSDFTAEFRGTIEKKTNEDEEDWSDVDAVVAALEDPSDAGLAALGEIVDLDRFLTFWAVEVLVGHWDGYAGNRNNYQFYREPGGRFVFIPWGVDQAFHLQDDPNPFDKISNPPPSVLALTAIPNRLYHDDEWQDRYVRRLKELLDTVWDEDELLASVDGLAAIVQEHALPERRAAAAADTERVRQFILKRRAEILDDLTPAPPEWPAPEQPEAERGSVEVRFEATWGSNRSGNPLAEGKVTFLAVNGAELPADDLGVVAGHASAEEAGFGIEEAASLAFISLEADGSLSGFTIVAPMAALRDGATLVIGEHRIAGGVWTIPRGSSTPDSFAPFSEGKLHLEEASAIEGATISGSFSGAWGGVPPALPPEEEASAPAETSDTGLVINEVAAQGDPLDWFELHNSSGSHLALANFVMADDLLDAGKRVAFPANLVIPPGGYLRIELDKDGWPGFALGRDEELGIWTAGGVLVAEVDWEEGQADEGTSYARIPDGTGDFQTVHNPTPGEANQPDN
ncbi:MAG: hypothetical protein F4Y92_07865 [Dehalococcoidia bacterium]|nr:hypothetical protein [Dehalococcoidia bacterium]